MNYVSYAFCDWFFTLYTWSSVNWLMHPEISWTALCIVILHLQYCQSLKLHSTCDCLRVVSSLCGVIAYFSVVVRTSDLQPRGHRLESRPLRFTYNPGQQCRICQVGWRVWPPGEMVDPHRKLKNKLGVVNEPPGLRWKVILFCCHRNDSTCCMIDVPVSDLLVVIVIAPCKQFVSLEHKGSLSKKSKFFRKWL